MRTIDLNATDTPTTSTDADLIAECEAAIDDPSGYDAADLVALGDAADAAGLSDLAERLELLADDARDEEFGTPEELVGHATAPKATPRGAKAPAKATRGARKTTKTTRTARKTSTRSKITEDAATTPSGYTGRRSFACRCGCGQPGHSTYRPGHDSRHASQVAADRIQSREAARAAKAPAKAAK